MNKNEVTPASATAKVVKAKPVVTTPEIDSNAWAFGKLDFIYPDETDPDVYAEIRREKIGYRRPIARLALGVHRVDVWSTPDSTLLAIVRSLPAKVRVTSFVDHDVVPLSEKRDTVRLVSMGHLPFSTGLTAIVAPGGKGKSPLLWQLATAFEKSGRQVRRIKFGEPRGEFITDYTDLMTQLLSALMLGQDVLIDSLKNPVYDLPGAASIGGMSSWLWPTLSDISAVFDRRGLSVVALINPTSAEQRVVANAVEALKTSTNGIITTSTGGQWAGYYRDIETGDRLEIAFFADGNRFEYDGVTVKPNEDAITVAAAGVSSTTRLSVDTVLANALSKLIAAEATEE